MYIILYKFFNLLKNNIHINFLYNNRLPSNLITPEQVRVQESKPMGLSLVNMSIILSLDLSARNRPDRP